MKKCLISLALGLMLNAVGLTAAFGATTTSTEQACPALNEQKVAALFDRWNDSLQTKDPQKVAANYAEDAVLLPTVSNQPRANHAQIIDYFTSFLKANPRGKIDWRVVRVGPDWASDTGLYTFQLTEDGKTRYAKARYSFVYECINGQWLIVHHHSSVLPNPEDKENH